MITNLKDELKIRDDQISVLAKNLEEARLITGGVSIFFFEKDRVLRSYKGKLNPWKHIMRG